MTSPLRRRHRAVWILLSVLLPVLLALSLFSRHVPKGNPQLRWEEFP